MACLYDYIDETDEYDDDSLSEYLSRLGIHHEDLRINDLELAKSQKLRMSVLQSYDVPAEILKIEQNQSLYGDRIAPELSELLERKPLFRKVEVYYNAAYTKMIQLEEACQSTYLVQFNHQNIKLTYSGEDSEFLIKNDNKVSRMAEAVDESILDWFTLKPKPIRGDKSISGQIRACNKDYIFVEIAEEDVDYMKRNCPIELYDIHFHINRMPYQLQHNALEWMSSHNLFQHLIDNPKYDQSCHEMHDPFLSFLPKYNEFSGTLMSKLNEEQKSAAFNIIKAKNAPLPYLLFGPAGTGKTGTLVAAIEEIVRSTSNHVLVCANSNAACDEIAERLIKVLRPDEMYRMYAKSYDYRKISAQIKPICNLRKKEFFFPSLRYLYHFRVLICTLTTAGCLTRAREERCFSSSHFSHIIIDEAASTHETVSMIPIAGLCTSRNQIHSSIVLAGDPKQLDAVTKSGNAVKLGFRTSFLENLFNRELYKRNPKTGEYNERYITQLVKNYRSHSAILNIPNALFYENKLEAKASPDITNWYIGSKLLPSKSFPVIFKSVQGLCRQSPEDFSLYNMKEVNVVIDYVKELLKKENNPKSITEADIGIVTPYKLQTKVISRTCQKNGFKNITIGTAEVFQGQERPVMIVSTVRTGGILGFVKDPRRLNVVITRAKCLLIIVGDPHTLCLDGNWKTLIKYCMQNNAIIQGERLFL